MTIPFSHGRTGRRLVRHSLSLAFAVPALALLPGGDQTAKADRPLPDPVSGDPDAYFDSISPNPVGRGETLVVRGHCNSPAEEISYVEVHFFPKRPQGDEMLYGQTTPNDDGSFEITIFVPEIFSSGSFLGGVKCIDVTGSYPLNVGILDNALTVKP